MDALLRNIQRARYLASPRFLQGVSQHMGARSQELVDEGYANRRDPDGAAWLPTKQRNPILERTGAYRASWQLAFGRNAFVLTAAGIPYARFHEYGTARLPRRRTIPVGGRPLPPRWSQRLTEGVNADFRYALRGGWL